MPPSRSVSRRRPARAGAGPARARPPGREEERSRAFSERDEEGRRRTKELAQREQKLSEREGRLTKTEERLLAKERDLDTRDSELATWQSQIHEDADRMKRQIAEQSAEVREAHARLSEADARELELAAREAELNRRESALGRVEKNENRGRELEEKAKLQAEREAELAEREAAARRGGEPRRVAQEPDRAAREAHRGLRSSDARPHPRPRRPRGRARAPRGDPRGRPRDPDGQAGEAREGSGRAGGEARREGERAGLLRREGAARAAASRVGVVGQEPRAGARGRRDLERGVDPKACGTERRPEPGSGRRLFPARAGPRSRNERTASEPLLAAPWQPFELRMDETGRSSPMAQWNDRHSLVTVSMAPAAMSRGQTLWTWRQADVAGPTERVAVPFGVLRDRTERTGRGPPRTARRPFSSGAAPAQFLQVAVHRLAGGPRASSCRCSRLGTGAMPARSLVTRPPWARRVAPAREQAPRLPQRDPSCRNPSRPRAPRDGRTRTELKRPAPAARRGPLPCEASYWTLSSIRAAAPRDMSAAISVKIVRSCPGGGLVVELLRPGGDPLQRLVGRDRGRLVAPVPRLAPVGAAVQSVEVVADRVDDRALALDRSRRPDALVARLLPVGELAVVRRPDVGSAVREEDDDVLDVRAAVQVELRLRLLDRVRVGRACRRPSGS